MSVESVSSYFELQQWLCILAQFLCKEDNYWLQIKRAIKMNRQLSRQVLTQLLFSKVDFETFSKILNRPGGFRDPGEPEEYCRGFQVFDKDMTGFIGVGQLKYILTNLGEKMTDEEVEELLKSIDTSSGQVNYTGACTNYLYLSHLQGG